MSAQWDRLVESDGFQRLPPDERARVRNNYFEKVLAPRIPPEKLGTALKRWDSYRPEDKRNPKAVELMGDAGYAEAPTRSRLPVPLRADLLDDVQPGEIYNDAQGRQAVIKNGQAFPMSAGFDQSTAAPQTIARAQPEPAAPDVSEDVLRGAFGKASPDRERPASGNLATDAAMSLGARAAMLPADLAVGTADLAARGVRGGFRAYDALGIPGAGWVAEQIKPIKDQQALQDTYVRGRRAIQDAVSRNLSLETQEQQQAVSAAMDAAADGSGSLLDMVNQVWAGASAMTNNPRALAVTVAETVPDMFVAGGFARAAAAPLFKKTYDLHVRAGFNPRAAALIAAKRTAVKATGAVAGAEATIAANMSADEAAAAIDDVSDEELAAVSPRFASLMPQVGAVEARRMMKSSAMDTAAQLSAGITAVAGRLTGASSQIGKIATRGIVPETVARSVPSAVARGVGAQTGEEFIQEGGDAFAQNRAAIDSGADPERDSMRGVMAQAGAGAVAGAALGGPIGAAGNIGTGEPLKPGPTKPRMSLREYMEVRSGKKKAAPPVAPKAEPAKSVVVEGVTLTQQTDEDGTPYWTAPGVERAFTAPEEFAEWRAEQNADAAVTAEIKTLLERETPSGEISPAEVAAASNGQPGDQTLGGPRALPADEGRADGDGGADAGMPAPGMRPPVPVAEPKSKRAPALKTPPTGGVSRSKAPKPETAEDIEANERRYLMKMLRGTGIDIGERADITREQPRTAARMAPGLFRKGGRTIDDVATDLYNAGFISETDFNDVDGGVQAARDLIYNAITKSEPVLSIEARDRWIALRNDEAMTAQDAADELGVDAVDALALTSRDLSGDNKPDVIDYALVEQANEVDEAAVEMAARQFENDDAAFMRAVQEIIDGRAEAARQADQVAASGAGREADARGSGQAVATGEPAASQTEVTQGPDSGAFSLEQQTEASRQKDEARVAQAEAQKQKQRQHAEMRAQSEREAGDFTLTGSDRPADVGAARGQTDIFATDTDVGSKPGNPVAATSAASENRKADGVESDGRVSDPGKLPFDAIVETADGRKFAVSGGRFGRLRGQPARADGSFEMSADATVDFATDEMAADKFPSALKDPVFYRGERVGQKSESTPAAQFTRPQIDDATERAVQKVRILVAGKEVKDLRAATGVKRLTRRSELEAEAVRQAQENPLAVADALGIELAPEVRAPLEQLYGQTPNTPAPAVADAQAGRLDDFGEKLGGARKDESPSLDREITDADIAAQPLSKIWPKSEIDAVEDKFIAALLTAARAEIPAKPRKGYKLTRWVQTVQQMRGMARTVQAVGRGKIDDLIKETPSLGNWYSKVRLMEAIDRDQWSRIGGVVEAPDAYTYIEGERVNQPAVMVDIDGRKSWFQGFGDIDGALPRIREKLAGTEPATSKMQFEIRIRRKDGKVFINKKGDSEHRALREFDNPKQARAFINDNYDDLVAEWEGVKDRDNVRKSDVRRSENRPRTGADRRNGRDADEAMFSEAFGFRGVEFGNWLQQGTGQKDRQGMLNEVYDALMDLSDVVGVPPRAMSLGGTLGLGLGSRGKGGKAAAHFEPDTLVINLTKTKGAGSLAHEWFHALDNYFARKRDGGESFQGTNFITYKPEPLMVRKDRSRLFPLMTRGQLLAKRRALGDQTDNFNDDKWERDPSAPQGVRPEVEERFADLVEALNESPMAARARLLDSDKKAYWSQIIERGARSFENYVISKMMEKGYQNDFLANVVALEAFTRDKGRYPYLMPEEVAPVAQAFDALFDTIETRQDGDNVVLFSRDGQSAADQTQTAEFKRWFGDWAKARNAAIINGDPVATLNLDDAPGGGFANIAQWAARIFQQQGGKATQPEIGDVVLNEQAARDSLAHGGANKAKQAAFAAVKDVIERGALFHTVREGARDSHYIAAPVRISGRDNIVMVLVRRHPDSQRMYLHGVGLKERLQGQSVSAADAEASGRSSATADEGAWDTVLRELVNFNPGTVSKVVDAEGKPRQVFHVTKGDFTQFREDKPIFVGFSETQASAAALSSGKTMAMYARVLRPANTPETPVSFLDVTRTLRDNPGADGVYVSDEGGVSLALRSSSQLKSATDNRGAFDPADPDITRLQADGTVPASNRPDAPEWDRSQVEKLNGILARQAGQDVPLRAVDAPRAMRDLSQTMETLLGRKAVFFESNDPRAPAGVYVSGGVLFVNADAKQPLRHVLGHEFTHSLEGPAAELHAILKARVLEMAKAGAFPAYEARLEKVYQRDGLPKLSRAKVENEFVADVMGSIMSDPKVLFDLKQRMEPSAFQRLVNAINAWIDGLLARLRGDDMRQSDFAKRTMRDLEGVKALVADVLQATAEGQLRPSMGDTAPAFSGEGQTAGETFYSALTQNVEAFKQPKASPQMWKGIITNLSQKGVKKEEVEWSGVMEWLDQQKGSVTKESLAEYLRQNEVQVEEMELGAGGRSNQALPEGWEYRETMNGWAVDDDGGDQMGVGTTRDAALQDAMGADPIHNPTRYGDYQTPGGENYRELLLTLPTKPRSENDAGAMFYDRFARRGGDPGWADLSQEQRQSIIDDMPSEARKASASEQYRSSHFDEPNILAHVRFNERTDAEGKRVLFIEEVQSDWHQEGRKKGYADKPLSQEPMVATINESGTEPYFEVRTEAGAFVANVVDLDVATATPEQAVEAARQMADRRADRRVPDAPFKQSWPMLAMKRMIRYASENGFDKLAWLPGEQQAARYDLSKQVRALSAEPSSEGRYNVRVELSDGRVERQANQSEEQIEALVGKEVASKLIAGEQRFREANAKYREALRNDAPEAEVVRLEDEKYEAERARTLSGLDLKVGGEGMKAFYDRELRNEVGKYVKKWGSKVGSTSIEALELDELAVHSIDITPQMRDAAMAGQPLFARQAEPDSLKRADMLTSMSPVSVDTPSSVDAAATAYRQMVGRSVETADGNQVQIVNRALRKMRSHSADPRMRAVIGSVGELLPASRLLWSQPVRSKPDDSTAAFHHFGVRARIAREPVFVRYVVRENVNGDMLYDGDAIIEAQKIPGASQLTAPMAAPRSPEDSQSIAQWLESVNAGRIMGDEQARTMQDQEAVTALGEAASGQPAERVRARVAAAVEAGRAGKVPRTFEAADDVTQNPPDGGFSDSGAAFSRRQTETPEFKRWFGDSQAFDLVNADTGRPVTSSREPARKVPTMMYHTTRNDFDAFEAGRDSITSTTFGDLETNRHAIFFTEELDASQAYGKMDGKFREGANVMPVYIKAENPLDMGGGVLEGADARRINAAGGNERDFYRFHWSAFDDESGAEMVETLKRAGYDSVIFWDENPETGDSFKAYAVFSPNQIKSATGNNGNFDPEDPRISFSRRGQTDPDDADGLMTETLGKETVGQKLYRNVLNRFSEVERAVKYLKGKGVAIPDERDPGSLEKTFYGRTQTRLDDLKDTTEALFKVMNKADVSFKQASDYLYALHARERNAAIAERNSRFPDGGSGMTNRQAAKILADTAALPKEQRDALAEVSRVVQAINRQKLNLMREAGLISAQQYQDLTTGYQHYVPLKSVVDPEEQGQGTGNGFDQRSTVIREAFGRASRAEDPLAVALLDAQKTFVRAEKNRVGRAVYDLILETSGNEGLISGPAGDYWRVLTPEEYPKQARKVKVPVIDEKTGRSILDAKGRPVTKEDVQYVPNMNDLYRRDEIFMARVDGNLVVMEFQNKQLAKQLKNMAGEQLTGVLRGMSVATKFFGRLLTQYNPEFAVPNFVRDVQTAYLNAFGADMKNPKGFAGQVLNNVRKGMAAAYRGKTDPLYREFLEAGGSTGAYGLTGVDDIKAEYEKLVEQQRKGITPWLVISAGKKFIEKVERFNEVFENTTRLAIYKAARDRGLSKQESARLAKDTTVNFNQKGELQWPGALYVFFNAAMQGNIAMLKAAARSKVTQSAMAGLMIFGLLESLAEGDDDEGEPMGDAAGKWSLGREFTAFLDDNTFIKVPLAYGYNVPYAMGRMLGRSIKGNASPAEAIGTSLSTFMTSFVPTDTLVPTIAEPFLSVLNNETAFDSTIYRRSFGDDTFDPIAYRDYEEKRLTGLMQMLHQLAGGDRYEPNVIKEATGFDPFSASGAEALVKGYIGPQWRLATGLVGALAAGGKAVTGNFTADDVPDLNDVPVTRRFVNERPPFFYDSRFGDITREADAARKTIESMRESRTPISDRYTPEQVRAVNNTRLFAAYDRKLRKAIDMTPDETRKAELEARRAKLVKDSIRRYNEAFE